MTKIVKESSFEKLINEEYLLYDGLASEIYKKSIQKYIENLKKAHNQEITEKDNHITFLENTISSEIVLRDELIEKLKQNQLFQKDFDGVETYFGFGDWTGYREQRPWIKMHKINNLPVCNCVKPCGWYLGHYWTHDEYLKKRVK